MIIGISGKMLSGKDTIASIIKDIHPEYNIIHFADGLKSVVADLCGLDWYDINTQEGKRGSISWLDNMTVREILQKFGTAIRKEVHPDFWVNSTMQDIYGIDNIIIPDVRFPNEKKAIEHKGGVVIRVKRPNIEQMDHESETALDNYSFKYTIYNDGTLEDLSKKVELLCKQLSF